MDTESTFAELAGFSAAPGLRTFFVSEDVSPQWLETLREAEGADAWRYGFFIVERSRNHA